MIERTLNLPTLLEKGSHFLLGPRGTGKSYLIRHTLKNICYINLLSSKTYLHLKTAPWELEPMISGNLVAIDEIQRIPELLNEVHRLIEERGVTFLLTGSSARKLRRQGVNLLAGRARNGWMHPLTWYELYARGSFDLDRYLRFGGLPTAYLGQDSDYLYAYVDTYLKEEIQAEALVRNLANYGRFLDNASLVSGQVLNYTKLGNDAQLSPNTISDYYGILEDTLVGYRLPSWTKSTKRKAVQTAKFYIFDVGVLNALRGVESIEEKTDYFGMLFEHFIANELRAYLSYKRSRQPLHYWRTTSQFEVDLVMGDKLAIEVKASKNVSTRDHKGLRALAEEGHWNHRLVVSRDPQAMVFDSGIKHLHWESFFQKLWAGEFD